MTNNPLHKRLFIMTGDPSGDFHAANIVKALKAKQPDIEVAAVGGVNLEAQGVQLIHTQEKLGRFGMSSYTGIPYHIALGYKVFFFLRKFKPDGILLIDYGGFNLWMAMHLKKRGYNVFYFIPPQIWASRKYRMKTIQRFVDHVFCIFPFEPSMYEEAGVPVTYVGHPLLGQLPEKADRAEFCAQNSSEQFKLDPSKSIVAVFPGSRKSEIEMLLAPILGSLPEIAAKHPDVQFVLAKANHFAPGYLEAQIDAIKQTIPNLPPITLVQNQNHALLSVADAAILKSGTVTLEAALYDCPMVIIYKINPILFQIAKRLVNTPYIGLPNILSCIPDINHAMRNREPAVCPELLQNDVNPQTLTEHFLPLLDPQSVDYRAQKKAFAKIRDTLGEFNAPDTVASGLLALVESN